MIENPSYSAVTESTENWHKMQGDALTVAYELLDYAKRLEHRLGIDSRLINKYRHRLRGLKDA